MALRGHRKSMEDRENNDNNPGNFLKDLREITFLKRFTRDYIS